GDDVLIGSTSYLAAAQIFRFSPATNQLERTALAAPSKVSFADAEVVREMAVSKDGTKVPVNIVMKKGTKLDGTNPVLLYGYGGYGISQTPYFLGATWRLCLDAGGVYAVANIRGGAEYGERWHENGRLTK